MKVYGKAVTRGPGWAYVEDVGAIVIPWGVDDREVKRLARGAIKTKSRIVARMKKREIWADIFAR